MSLPRASWAIPACLTLCGTLPSTPTGAWDEAPAFSVRPADLLKASAAIPATAGHNVTELLEETQVSIDDQGRRTVRYRYIFRIDQATAVEGWSTVSAPYAPWLDEKPQIRARVITPDGHEHHLDPATVADYTPDTSSPEMFTDRKELKAPLPKLAKGALAEVEILSKEHRAFSKVGTHGMSSLWQSVPVHKTRFTLEAPAGVPLRWKLRGLPGLQLRPQIQDGRQRLVLELGASTPSRNREPYQAPDQDPFPAILYTTTPTWAAAAAEYSATVEAQLKGADVKAWVQKAVGDATTPEDKLRRILVNLHKDVRYTGLEFGEASVVPRPPAETFKRGYGDCKDKSALLVTLLREVGITAHLALLRVGSPDDVEPDLPGLSSFDHAIVHLPGSAHPWIDPTVPEAPLGVLPAPDLGRRALVIHETSPGLLTTQDSTPEQNTTLETREVFLAEDGAGRLVEVTEARGPSEIQLRSGYVDVEAKKAREHLKNYVEQAYRAKDLGKVDYAHAGDTSRPFKLSVEALKVGVASTDTEAASVSLNPWLVVNGLNQTLQAHGNDEDEEESEEGKKEDTKAAEDLPPPRRTDLLMGAPYRMEHRWVVHPPQGYAHDTLPTSRTLNLGAARLSMTFKELPNGAVEAHYRADCPKRRWSPKEVNEGRAALKAFGEEKVPILVFQQVGEAHLSAGRTKEALTEFRRLQEAHPSLAGPLTRVARAQLAAGLGESARETLRQAVRLEPTSSLGFRTLGWVLQHDWLGRRFRPGWDRAGAVEAYRKALSLDPKDRVARMDLAILLEHNVQGERYGAGTELKEAAEHYRTLIDEEKNDTLQDSLMVCLARNGRLSEAMEVALTREPSQRANGWLVALEGLQRGLDKALAFGRTRYPDLATRRAAYLMAAEVAIVFRSYPMAASLLQEGSTGSGDVTQVRARAEMLSKVKRYDTLKLDPKDPRDTARSMFLALMDRPWTAKTLQKYVTEAQLTAPQVKRLEKEFNQATEALLKQSLPLTVMVDLMASLTDFAVDGDDAKGYRVLSQTQGNTTNSFFVAKVAQGLRVVGENLPELARQAQWHALRGELAQARAWLDHLVENSRKSEALDPLMGHPIRHLWEKGKEGTQEEILRAAAAALAMVKEDREAQDRLRPLLKADLPKLMAAGIAQSLAAGAASRKDHALLDEASARLLSLFPDSVMATNLRLNALSAKVQWKQALELLESALAKHPEDLSLISRKSWLLWRVGRYEDSETELKARIQRGKADPGDFNNLAWWQVVRGRQDAQTLEHARRAVQGSGARSDAAHHTLATVLAEFGRTAEALETLLKAVSLRQDDNPKGADWYVLGRLAEHLGEKAAAEAYYLRVKPDPEDEDEGEGGCPAMAAKRLEVLRGGGGK